jgi:hypothetical protein
MGLKIQLREIRRSIERLVNETHLLRLKESSPTDFASLFSPGGLVVEMRQCLIDIFV